MKKKVVFMLQNGIGFGHFKLALTISKYLDGKCDISFITQAKSTAIFDDYNYKVYNFPMLYTLKSNNEILIINNIINKLIENIKPDIIIEDTYPEDFYLNLPSLINTSKILLLNRLNSSEFENYYFNGVLNQYDKLIVLKDKECFINDITSLEVKNYVNNSKKIVYLSGVFNEPSSSIEKSITQKYNLDKYDKNIVVSCGAGGWHIGSNICEEVFRKTIQSTNDLILRENNIQLILVLGPYSKYLEKQFKKEFNNNDNIKIVDFETNLDALFHVVDLCILRPGYNSTMEAISGKANVLLLPGISYLEDQEIWCKELKDNYGIDYLKVEELDKLPTKIEYLLKRNIRKAKKIDNNTINVAKEIYNQMKKKPTNKTIRMAINILDKNDSTSIKKLSDYNINVLSNNKDNFYIGKIPVLNIGNISPKDYKNFDSFIIYNDTKFVYNRLSYYDNRYHLCNDGHIIIEYEEILHKTVETTISQLEAILNNPQKFNDNIIIKMNSINENDIDALIKYMKENNIVVECLDEYLNEIVNAKASGHKYGYYKPEITKLS